LKSVMPITQPATNRMMRSHFNANYSARCFLLAALSDDDLHRGKNVWRSAKRLWFAVIIAVSAPSTRGESGLAAPDALTLIPLVSVRDSWVPERGEPWNAETMCAVALRMADTIGIAVLTIRATG
jgi:hypothetical protein